MSTSTPWPGTFLDQLPTQSDFIEVPTERSFHRKVPGVYLLISAEGDVVYIGQSGDVPQRVRDHRKEGKKLFSRALFWPQADYQTRLKTETILIVAHTPRSNRGLHLGLAAGRLWEIQWAQKGPGKARPRTRADLAQGG